MNGGVCPHQQAMKEHDVKHYEFVPDDTIEIAPKHSGLAAPFRFDGGVGALMPCYGPIGWQGNSDSRQKGGSNG